MATNKRPSFKLQETLNRMNWHMGKGDIVAIEFTDETSGIVSRSIPVSQNGYRGDSRRFSVNGNKVKFLGKTRTIGYKIR